MRRTTDGVVNRPRTTRRTRIARACNTCRARKQRCDGQRPTCSTCSAIHQPCSYDSDRKKRGLPTGYVRSLELLWALVFAVVPNSKIIVSELMAEMKFGLDTRAKLVVMSKFVRDPDVLRQAWDDSGVQGELDQLLANVQYNVDMRPHVVEKEGISPENPTLVTGKSFDAIQSSLSEEDQRASEFTTELAHANNIEKDLHQKSPAMVARLSEEAREHGLPQNSQRLLDIYFAHTHCWLPIVEKHEMFEILYSSSTDAFFEPGSLATFWAILAYSSLQESPEPDSPASMSSHTSNLLTPEQMYAKARQLIPDEESYGPSYAQAILILSNFKLHQGRVRAAWVLIGHAVRISSNLWTLPSDTRGPSTTARNRGDEKLSRLLLSSFVLDTIISCHLGKPPHLKSSNIFSLPMPIETGPDEWEPRTAILSKPHNERNTIRGPHEPLRAISIFNQFVGIVRILNDIISEPLMRLSGNLQSKHVSALRYWYAQLPQHCVIPTSLNANGLENAQMVSPQLINLHLALTCTKALLEAQQAPSIPIDIHTPSLKVNRLVSIFSKQFSMATMPAIFSSYKAICRRGPTSNGLLGFHSHLTPLSIQGNPLHDVISPGLTARYLPTPVEYPESIRDSGSDKPYNSASPVSEQRGKRASASSPMRAPTRKVEAIGSRTDSKCPDNLTERSPVTDPMNEDEKETWESLLNSAGIDEVGISDHNFLESLENLNGMWW